VLACKTLMSFSSSSGFVMVCQRHRHALRVSLDLETGSGGYPPGRGFKSLRPLPLQPALDTSAKLVGNRNGVRSDESERRK
jgi:hypothetical protein